MSRTLRTPGLPPTHGPVGYRWQNTGSFCSLINTRATSCRTSPVGVGASVLPQWRGAIVPKPAEATCRAHPTRRQAIRAGGGAARAAAKRRPRGEAVPGAGRTGVRKSVAKERVRAAAGAPARNHERHATRRLARAYGERKRNFVGQHFWARGYFVSTVGRDEEVVRRSIRHQEQEDQRLDQLSLWR